MPNYIENLLKPKTLEQFKAGLPKDEQIIRDMKKAFNVTKQRCYNPDNSDYKRYGARGITICERWLNDFNNLVRDMGLRPEGLTLERLDNEGPYSPNNCIWATRKTQSMNKEHTKTITLDGVTRPLTEWAILKNIPYNTLKARINVLKYTPEEALSKPVKAGTKLVGKEYAPHPRTLMTGLVPKGLSSKLTALNLEQIQEIKEHLANGVAKTHIAIEYKVNVSTITAVQLKKGAYSDT